MEHKEIREWATLIINAVMLGITVFLLSQTKHQTESALRSANAAEKSAQDAHEAFINSSAEYERQLKETKKRYELDSANAHAQVHALSDAVIELKNQFRVDKEPYIKISPSISSFEIGKPIVIRYIVSNLGTYPVKLLESQNYIGYKKNASIKLSPDTTFNVNDYIIHEPLPLSATDKISRPLTQSRAAAIATGREFIWYSGFIKYQNLVTKERKVYKFNFRLNSTGLVEILQNDNYLLP